MLFIKFPFLNFYKFSLLRNSYVSSLRVPSNKNSSPQTEKKNNLETFFLQSSKKTWPVVAAIPRKGIWNFLKGNGALGSLNLNKAGKY